MMRYVLSYISYLTTGGKMINALNLIWIIPLSMIAGAATMAVLACVLIKDEYRKMLEDEECIKIDDRNA